MNDEFDSLEAELAALSPREPSSQLARRIAAELDRSERAPAHRLSIREIVAALAVGAVAASAIAVAWIWRENEQVTQADPPAAPIALPLASAFDPALPSVWSFRRAAQSAGELNALLDEHAGRAPSERLQYVQIRGFGASESERHDLLGEL